MPADDWQPFDAVVDRALSPRRFMLQVLGAFAGVALLLAALGLYAVLSYTVSQRANEIGIRMALGETAARVRRRVVTRTLGLAALGVAAGSAAALAGGRLVATLLFDVSAVDPVTYLGTAGCCSSWRRSQGGCRRAEQSRMDPAVALRG